MWDVFWRDFHKLSSESLFCYLFETGLPLIKPKKRKKQEKLGLNLHLSFYV
jgi:hypothetical protein